MNNNKWDAIFDIGKIILIVCVVFIIFAGIDGMISEPSDERYEMYMELHDQLTDIRDASEKLSKKVYSYEHSNRKVFSNLEGPTADICVNIEEAIDLLEQLMESN